MGEKGSRRRQSRFTTYGIWLLVLAMFLCIVGLIALKILSFEKNYRFYVFLVLIIAALVILGTIIAVIGFGVDFYRYKQNKKLKRIKSKDNEEQDK